MISANFGKGKLCNEKDEAIIFVCGFIFYDYACCVQFTGREGDTGCS